MLRTCLLICARLEREPASDCGERFESRTRRLVGRLVRGSWAMGVRPTPVILRSTAQAIVAAPISRLKLPSHDFTPTGEMSLEIDPWGAYGVAGHRFADRGPTRIEQRLGDILTSFVAIGAGRVVARAEAAERARVAELARLERARLQRLAEFESARTTWLTARVAMHQERDRLAAFGPSTGGIRAVIRCSWRGHSRSSPSLITI